MAERTRLHVYAPVELGWSRSILHATVESAPDAPLENTWRGFGVVFGARLSYRLGDHGYLAIPVFVLNGAVGKVQEGDGRPFRNNARIHMSALPFGIRLGAGFGRVGRLRCAQRPSGLRCAQRPSGPASPAEGLPGGGDG